MEGKIWDLLSDRQYKTDRRGSVTQSTFTPNLLSRRIYFCRPAGAHDFQLFGGRSWPPTFSQIGRSTAGCTEDERGNLLHNRNCSGGQAPRCTRRGLFYKTDTLISAQGVDVGPEDPTGHVETSVKFRFAPVEMGLLLHGIEKGGLSGCVVARLTSSQYSSGCVRAAEWGRLPAGGSVLLCRTDFGDRFDPTIAGFRRVLRGESHP